MKKFMKMALEEAEKAKAIGEIPIGAIIVKDGEIVGRGHNLTESIKDPTAHAEILAIRDAAKNLGGWRLFGCTMYVTVEPCAMCAGALVWSRIDKLVYGTKDPKAGACGSVMNIVQNSDLNHRLDVESGLMEDECKEIIQDFFRKLRDTKKKDKLEETT